MKKKEIAKLKPGDIIVRPGMSVPNKPINAGLAVIVDQKKIAPSYYIVMIKEIIQYGMGNIMDRNYGEVKEAFSMKFFYKLDLEDKDQRTFLLAAGKDIIINLFKYM